MIWQLHYTCPAHGGTRPKGRGCRSRAPQLPGMNIEVFILGTGGMMPLPGRGLTSVLVRREGDLFLFDCGEATQIAFRRLNLRWKKISHIFISHTHADHVTGLPGMLSLSSQVERSEPLHVYGPPRVRAYIEQSLQVLDIYINYEIVIHETLDSGPLVTGDGFQVHAYRLRHSKPSSPQGRVSATRWWRMNGPACSFPSAPRPSVCRAGRCGGGCRAAPP